MPNQLNIRFNYKPLLVTQGIVAANGLPARQDYCADTGEHTPDYAQTPIVLKPVVRAIDRDTEESRSANALLADLQWEESVGGGPWTPILSSTPGYSMEPGGSPSAGALTVAKNAAPDQPLSLRFTAVLHDWRHGHARHFIEIVETIHCAASTEFPKLALSVGEHNFFNPVRDASRLVVEASLAVMGEEVPQANRLLKWEAYDPDSKAWHDLGALLDYWAVLLADGRSVAVNMALMGSDAGLRCTAAYDPYGSPSLSAIGPGAPRAEAYFHRRLTAMRADIQRVPAELPPNATAISPEAVVRDRFGAIEGADSLFDITWKMRSNASGKAAHPEVAKGSRPTISIASMHALNGASLQIEVEDRGPLKAWADSDGALLTDPDGAILLIK